MTKVLHCITGLTGDGAQRMLLRLVTELSEVGYSNVVVSMMGRGALSASFEKVGVPVHHLDMAANMPNPRGLAKLASIVRSDTPDVLQGWMYHANLALSLGRAVSRTPLPLIWNIRRGLDDYKERKALKRGLANFVIGVGEVVSMALGVQSPNPMAAAPRAIHSTSFR